MPLEALRNEYFFTMSSKQAIMRRRNNISPAWLYHAGETGFRKKSDVNINLMIGGRGVHTFCFGLLCLLLLLCFLGLATLQLRQLCLQHFDLRLQQFLLFLFFLCRATAVSNIFQLLGQFSNLCG